MSRILPLICCDKLPVYRWTFYKNDDLKNKENTVIAVRNKIKHLEETLDNASTKKERKKIQREVKKLKNKLESGVDGAPGFTAPFGYLDEDAYLFTKKDRVMSIFDVIFRYGTNNIASPGWVNDVIPRSIIHHGEFHFIQRQRGMDKDSEDDVIAKHMKSNSETISKERKTEANAGERTRNQMRIDDISIAEELIGKEETIIDSDLMLIVKETDPDKIELALDELKDSYKDHAVKGIMTIRKTGEQLNSLRNILKEPHSDPRHNSDPTTIAASRLFLPSSGFSDENGEDIGYDMMAILPKQHALINFVDVKNAVIFSGGISAKGTFSNTGIRPTSIEFGGSALATVIGRSFWLGDSEKGYYGRRTHHIMLSDFDYRLPNSLSFDMRKEAINPFEVFGTPETVEDDFKANFKKAINMMMLLSEINEDDDEAKYARTDLETLLRRWYNEIAGGGGLYTKDPKNNPLRAQRVLADRQHEKYPLPTEFLPTLLNNVSEQSNKGDRARDRAEFLYKKMNGAFEDNPAIFDAHTTLPDIFTRDQRNIYYDLSQVSRDMKVRGALLINTLSYVVNRALDGETIIIHGLDRVDINEEMILDYQKIMKRRGIGKIIVFEESENSKINPETFSRFVGRLNTQDLVCVGGLSEVDINNIKWFQGLPETVVSRLIKQEDGNFFIYRKKDRLSTVIKTNIQF